MRVADIIARVFPKCGQLRMTPCFFWGGPLFGGRFPAQKPGTKRRPPTECFLLIEVSKTVLLHLSTQVDTVGGRLLVPGFWAGKRPPKRSPKNFKKGCRFMWSAPSQYSCDCVGNTRNGCSAGWQTLQGSRQHRD